MPTRIVLKSAPLFAVLLTAGFTVSAVSTNPPPAWPRVLNEGGYRITLFQPQLESWADGCLSARAAVEVTGGELSTPAVGLGTFQARAAVDTVARLVTLDNFTIAQLKFPAQPDAAPALSNAVRQAISRGARTVPLDQAQFALTMLKANARRASQQLRHDPPVVYYRTAPATLVVVDGDPALRPVSGSALQRVINTPALLLLDPGAQTYYLQGDGFWAQAGNLQGPWTPTANLPAAVQNLAAASASPGGSAGQLPEIIVSTQPAELLQTVGEPNWQPIPDAGLLYAYNSDRMLFYDQPNGFAYLLLSGRWYRAKSLHGPWTYVPPATLPSGFANIPTDHLKAAALASVPGTPAAEQARAASLIPHTATVNRGTAQLQVIYDGAPQFQPVVDTTLQYAVNAAPPVIQCGSGFYAVQNGVWFVSGAPQGPWAVCDNVPDAIYTIPPSSPLYNLTYAFVLNADTNSVEVGYTPGYTGAYESDGTPVFGTGYYYTPWVGNYYYGWGWTWGYGNLYDWGYYNWLWRPWWSRPYQPYLANTSDLYSRWPGEWVTPRSGALWATPTARATAAQYTAARPWGVPPAEGYNHPTLYQRFVGPAALAPLAPVSGAAWFNAYAPPRYNASGTLDTKGASMLLRSPREGLAQARDLYALPTGEIYQRKNGGWYQYSSAGNWAYAGPVNAARTTAADASAQARSAGQAWSAAPRAGYDAAARRSLQQESFTRDCSTYSYHPYSSVSDNYSSYYRPAYHPYSFHGWRR